MSLRRAENFSNNHDLVGSPGNNQRGRISIRIIAVGMNILFKFRGRIELTSFRFFVSYFFRNIEPTLSFLNDTYLWRSIQSQFIYRVNLFFVFSYDTALKNKWLLLYKIQGRLDIFKNTKRTKLNRRSFNGTPWIQRISQKTSFNRIDG